MSLNVFSLVISVLGGLALFIFGMTMMSDGLQMVSGEKMKRILHLFSCNRFIAVLAGALVTGVIQSSSACTVMVVGFVNAGLLNLTQAIGIVFGANIGTTATAQLISFDLGFLALPAVTIGVVIMLLAKKRIIKDWGQMLLGFGLLFFGMGMMSEELKVIGNFPSFMQFFNNFDCTPVNGRMPFISVLGAIGIGTAMTVLIQSSSATIGIALALAGSGLINFYTAIPLILGDNIGTTITAILASLNTNRRAKQAAVGHVLFNVLGATYMVLLFYVPYPGTDIPIFLYLINAITSGDVFAAVPENIERHIAMAHTMFNVFNVLLFLPFIAYIVKICNMIVKIEDEKKLVIQYLEPHLLETPSVAIEQSIKSLRYMLKEAWTMVDKSFNKSFLPAKTDKDLSTRLREKEEEVDKLQHDITEYLVQITKRELSEHQAEIIPLLMHCTNDAERIGDHADNILRLAKRFEASKGKLSESGRKELGKMWELLHSQAKSVIACFDDTDVNNISVALKDEKQINKYAKSFEKEHVKRLKKGSCDIVVGIIFIEILAELERVGDHLTNIAERAPEIQKHQLKL
ncbi:MAG: hypothetical protein A2017_03890 [Lentisphaerae bacterium GWF2_44_16]|nr:MAG: hypothetical protein A2017_03890 [Lentisphaerae bacterium GWF2_44_16]